jgi:predicted CXXCH cytochrome family protein
MASLKKRPKKKIFSAARLPIADRYMIPNGRGWLMWGSLAGVAGVALWLFLSLQFKGVEALARAPLSSSHANFESTCSACHEPFRSAVSENCLVCHERFGSADVFSYQAHFTAHPGIPDHDLTVPDAPERELPCAGCHAEHRGRQAEITAVADSLCLDCHRIGSFNTDHPEFEVLRGAVEDDPYLRFTHRTHVAYVVDANTFEDPQRACLACHQPEASGEGFKPLDFDQQCSTCHQIPHGDPQILEDLREIRQQLRPDPGLGDLLDAAVGPGWNGSEEDLYREAIVRLRSLAAGMRGSSRSSVRKLREIDRLLTSAEARLDGGDLGAGIGPFLTAGSYNPTLSATELARLQRRAADLTAPCIKCHTVSDAAILRVEKDQKALSRAHFNHRAHVVQRPFCVDCHGAIPGLLDEAPWAEELDVAQTWNIPGIESCRQCHTPREASNRCVTCHTFHPGRDAETTFRGYGLQRAAGS